MCCEKYTKMVKLVFLMCLALCYSQSLTDVTQNDVKTLHTGLTEKIGNFSIELLFHTSKTLNDDQNFIMSPITVWSVLAVIAEGASGGTKAEINNVLRLLSKNQNATRSGFREITQWLKVNTSTVQLAKINAIFVDKERLPIEEFKETARDWYETQMIALDFKDGDNAAKLLNQVVSNVTHGRIPTIVEPSFFQNSHLMLTSAVYFKGQWTVPFNTTSTTKMPFFNSNGQNIGEVNMMYNRYTYPFSNIRELQARVIELPYGVENRLSMLIMLPNPGVTLEDMFANFQNINLDSFFNQLRLSKEEYSEDEVDCYIPRFKIESNIDLTSVLKGRMGIEQLFDQGRARLPHMSRTPMYVTKIVHKAEIEVTEDGTTASGVTVAEFSNRIGAVQFHANRPFTYVIVEKVTNSIVFGGFYKKPSLY